MFSLDLTFDIGASCSWISSFCRPSLEKLIARLQLAGRRVAVEALPEPGLHGREPHAEMILERAGLLEAADVERVEADVADELLGHAARLVVRCEEL